MDRCTTCQYYDRQSRGAEKGATGQCRRQAPALSPINQKTYMIEGVWPTVRDDDWCGEWKARVRRVDPARVAEGLATPAPVLPAGVPRSAGLALPPRPLTEPRVPPSATLASASPAND